MCLYTIEDSWSSFEFSEEEYSPTPGEETSDSQEKLGSRHYVYAQPVLDNVNERFWKLVLDMNQDDRTDAVWKDKAILKLGEHLFNKHGHDVTKHEYIRQKMRETGRLLLQGKKYGKLQEMLDFFIPANFPHMVQAIKSVACLNEETNTSKHHLWHWS